MRQTRLALIKEKYEEKKRQLRGMNFSNKWKRKHPKGRCNLAVKSKEATGKVASKRSFIP
jgi:hypothetical protein